MPSVSCVTAERWSRDIHPGKKEDTENSGWVSLFGQFLLPAATTYLKAVTKSRSTSALRRFLTSRAITLESFEEEEELEGRTSLNITDLFPLIVLIAMSYCNLIAAFYKSNL